ncbi:hypothetical protein VYH81_04690 [Streptococcus anginosus]|uniref:hypothetical protein n=1 Tax=Streptococcus TaxID=1301 RepID=UPI000EC1E8F6|nr:MULTISPECIES: hypothetical protein [Streptococcus]KAA9269844.1 hypothetical protein F6I20_08790 [Streptococcus anginosus]MBS6902362.1 hypothetical protein [Streptococcus anginosus]MCO4486464.1 hypothetical protein [Streptococcus infantarius subsp. infantarius]MCO4539536.1 hypothetical protein [Streptococcus infantarius subsp. infantarius]MCO4544080.1 hypothetical protein [Streptococcus infantarius subsp. infantarius]
MKKGNSKVITIILGILALVVAIALLKVLSPLLFVGGLIGIWYFIKKKPNKQYRNIAIAITLVGFFGTALFNKPTSETKSTTTSSTVTTTSKSKEETKSSEELAASKASSEAAASKASEEKAKKEAETKASMEAAAAQKAKEEAEKKDPATYPTQTYDEMARNGDSHAGEKIQITGKVIQVQDSDDGGATLRVATSADGYDDVYLVQIMSSEWKGHRLLEDDQITIYGTVYGLYSYKTVMGNTQTVPAIIAVFY